MPDFPRLLAAILVCTLLASSLRVAAQHQAPLDAVNALFTAIRTADSATARLAFAPIATIQSVANLNGRMKLSTVPLENFIAQLGDLTPGQAEERVGPATLQQDDKLASIWMPYAFFVEGRRTHCGTNQFTLVEGREGWRILHVVDTRRVEDCPALDNRSRQRTLDTLMNRWHRAAATADEDVFFGTMSADGIYLGTDASERWLRDSMAVWAAPYFERDTAWAFTPVERHWAFSDDGTVAWFDEHLDGWMGIVRGSGVLTQDNKATASAGQARWLLRHYNLTLTVPNDRMNAVRYAIDSTAVMR